MSWRATAAAKALRPDTVMAYAEDGTPLPASLTSDQKLVLMMLADYHNDETDQCNPTIARLAEDCVLGERTVQRALSALARHYVIGIQRGGGGRRSASNYLLLFMQVLKQGASPIEPKGDNLTPLEERQGIPRSPASPQIPKGDNLTPLNAARAGRKGVTACTDRVSHQTRKGDRAVSPEQKRTTSREPSDLPSPSVPSSPQETAAPPPAAAAYQKAISDLKTATSKGRIVAILVDFSRAVCPEEWLHPNLGGRFADLQKRFRPIDIIDIIWDSCRRPLAGDPWSYVQRQLEGKRRRESAGGRPRTVQSDGDLEDWKRYKAGNG